MKTLTGCFLLFLAVAETAFSATTVTFHNVGSQGFYNTGSTNYWRFTHNGTVFTTGSPYIAPGGMSASYDVSSWIGQTIQFQVSIPTGGSYSNWSRLDVTSPAPDHGSTYSGSVLVVSGSAHIIDVFAGPFGADPTTNSCNVVLCARNNDTKYRVFCLWKNGQNYNAVNYPGGLGIGAGQIGCYEFTVACTNALGWSLAPAPGEEYAGGGYGTTNYNILTNTPGYSYPGVTNDVTPAGPTVFNPTNAPQSSNIIWTASSYTNTIMSQQQGDAALYDAITKAAQQNDQNLRDLKSLAGTATNLLYNNLWTNKQGNDIAVSGFNGLSNVNLGISNSIVDLKNSNTNQTAAIRNFHIDNTNLLAQILFASTNGMGTNGIDIPGPSTNEALARALAAGYLSTMDAEAGSTLDALNEGVPEFNQAAGSLAPLVIDMGPMIGVLDLTPESRFPGIGAVVQAGIMMILTLSLGRFLVNLYRETAATFAASQSGGSPNLDVLGVNAAGPAVGLAVAAIIVTIWVAVFALLFTYITTHLVAAYGNVNGWTTGNAVADYLLVYFFPINFMLSCAWTRIVAPFAVTKLVVATNAIQRFLIAH